MLVPTIARVAVLSLLLLGVPINASVASVVPWCAPAVALLTFEGRNGWTAAKVELLSIEAVCTIRGAEKSAGVSLERSMRIEYNGKMIDVPKSCLAGVSFRLDALSLSFGDTGVGVLIIGKTTRRGKKMKVEIYTIDSEVLCARGLD